MSVQPEPPVVFSARSLVLGRGHPSQLGRLNQPWWLTVPGLDAVVRRASPNDLPAVMGALVRCSSRTRWQWRAARGGVVPSIAEVDKWLAHPHSQLVMTTTMESPGRTLGAPRPVVRVLALARLDEAPCAGQSAPHAMIGEILVVDRWQGRGIGQALIRHLAGAAWLMGRRELWASPQVEEQAGNHLVASLGGVAVRRHPHGDHVAAVLSADSLAGLGQVQSGWLW